MKKRNDLHLVDARIKARDDSRDVEKELVACAIRRHRDRRQGSHMRVMLVGAQGYKAVQDRALLLQFGNQG